MKQLAMATAAIGLAVMAAGCQDRPHRYDDRRPPVTDLDSRDRGLQSKDVIEASDILAQYLLAMPEFNGPTRKTVVVTRIENRTMNPRFNYDIFLQRLRANIGQHGRDRIFLVENRQRVDNLRQSELEGGTGDTFDQTDGTAGSMGGSVQPEFALYGIISELPNRGTSYYLVEFNMTNLRTREQIPLRPYEVKVER